MWLVHIFRYFGAYVFCYTCSMLYSWSWDVFMDWGMLVCTKENNKLVGNSATATAVTSGVQLNNIQAAEAPSPEHTGEERVANVLNTASRKMLQTRSRSGDDLAEKMLSSGEASEVIDDGIGEEQSDLGYTAPSVDGDTCMNEQEQQLASSEANTKDDVAVVVEPQVPGVLNRSLRTPRVSSVSMEGDPKSGFMCCGYRARLRRLRAFPLPVYVGHSLVQSCGWACRCCMEMKITVNGACLIRYICGIVADFFLRSIWAFSLSPETYVVASHFSINTRLIRLAFKMLTCRFSVQVTIDVLPLCRPSSRVH